VAAQLPSFSDLSRIFGDLFGRSVRITKARQPLGSPDLKKLAVGLYGPAGSDEVSALWVCDLTAAAHMAAALSLMPANSARSAVDSGALTGILAENFNEVMNVAIASIGNSRRVVLKRTNIPPQLPEEAVEKALIRSAGRLDLDLAVSGYDAGRATLILL